MFDEYQSRRAQIKRITAKVIELERAAGDHIEQMKLLHEHYESATQIQKVQLKKSEARVESLQDTVTALRLQCYQLGEALAEALTKIIGT